MSKIIAYDLTDNQTKTVIKRYSVEKRNLARRRADKLDNQYGAYRYSARPVFEESECNSTISTLLES